jgi:hypothetical protein
MSPIANATVRLMWDTNAEFETGEPVPVATVATTKTDADGRYVLRAAATPGDETGRGAERRLAEPHRAHHD